MAPKTAPELEADAGGGPQSPELSTADLYGMVLERLRAVSPAGVSNPRLVWDIPGNSVPGMLPLTVPAVRLSELAESVLAVLVESEGWMKGEVIVAALNGKGVIAVHTNGTFRRAVDDLKDAGLIMSGPKGYRAKQ